MHRWSALQDFLEDFKSFLQSLLRRHGCQADAYGAWNSVAIDGKGRRRRDANAAFAAFLGQLFGAPCVRKSDPPMRRCLRRWYGLRQNAFGELVARRYFGPFEGNHPVG